MVEGKCHCGDATWTLELRPVSATACNCTVCRRYGAIWAYGYLSQDVNVTGTLETVHAAVGAMREGDGGSILLTTSTAGLFGDLGFSVYGAA